ncbi:uncharacterized protein BJX67DRAFT_381103 [Aspergillus lucknowensis]|uniref:Uncharacterized protein n=1 Tax=Aspergillus lucknowensis TaxID=176173 RepID=A0ABR4LSM2_9EURO
MVPSEQYFCRSSTPLPYHVNIGLVLDDLLEASILQEYGQLVGLGPVLGGRCSANYAVIKVHPPAGDMGRRGSRGQKELESSSEYSGVQFDEQRHHCCAVLEAGVHAKGGSNGRVDFVGPINGRGLPDLPEPSTYFTHNSIISLRYELSERDAQTGPIAKVAETIWFATI